MESKVEPKIRSEFNSSIGLWFEMEESRVQKKFDILLISIAQRSPRIKVNQDFLGEVSTCGNFLD